VVPDPTATPKPTPDPTAEPTRRAGRQVATRVVVPALNIDLPIVKGNDGYPYCNVAMYLHTANTEARDAFGQPGEGRATYLYAHARDGMFGPIYERSIQKKHGGPQSMIGMLVKVYTSDDFLYEYEITKVYLHQLSLDAPLNATSEQLWLQTSEGPHGTPGKTQILAEPIEVLAADHKAAHPTPHPVVCG
jgi:hypothetical protein